MTEKPELSRRTFMETAGVATGALVAAGTFAHPAIGNVKGANERLNFAILGPGGRAQAHINHLLAMKKEGKAVDIVAVCEDGLAALDAVAQHRPQVAFLDIRMPGVGGLDVARQVVAQGGLVVFTTAYEDYAIRAFEAGAADYLLKPVQDARLMQAVERVQAIDRVRKDDLGRHHLSVKGRSDVLPVSGAFQQRFRGM